jgi:hypothetical protein
LKKKPIIAISVAVQTSKRLFEGRFVLKRIKSSANEPVAPVMYRRINPYRIRPELRALR